MRRIAKREQETDGDRVDVADVGNLSERLELTRRAEPPAHPVAALERNERLGMLRTQPVQMRARLPAQVQEMLEAALPTYAVRPPRRSSSAFVAVVVPCAKRSTSRAPTARAAATTDSSWRSAVGTFAVRTRPPSSSTASVNVPPTSTPRIATCVLCIAVPIRAFLFDFDGLIIDTETASREGWEWLYREHGFELPQDQWATLIGTIGAPWEPMRHLEELVGAPLEHEELHERRRAHELSLLETEELRPGILEYLAEAERRGLKRAIVSSSSNRWIDMHLARLERAVGWDAIVAANHDVARAKPRPDLYLEASGLLGVATRRGDRLRGLAERRPRGAGGGHLLRRASRTT